MTRQDIAKLAAFLLVAALKIPCAAAAQELGLEKILNPMPDYDPFEKANAAPQFFPDEIDKQARELLIDALTDRKDGLDGHWQSLRAADNELRKQHGTVTGLADHAQDLLNNTIADRETYLAAQKDALKNSAAPARKKYLQAIIEGDDQIGRAHV